MPDTLVTPYLFSKGQKIGLCSIDVVRGTDLGNLNELPLSSVFRWKRARAIYEGVSGASI